MLFDFRKTFHEAVVNKPCVCCGSSESVLFLRTRFVQYPSNFDYRRCRGCGLVFNSPRVTKLSALYDKDYFLFTKDAERMRRHVLRQIQRLVLPAKAYASGMRLIEIGSARGHLLGALSQIGFNVQGIEPSADAVAMSRAVYQLSVFQGTLQEYLSSDLPRDFDFAVACTVLEHVDAPDVFVSGSAALLKPGGILAMDMPNIDSLNAAAAGAAWEMFQKYHIYMFSPSTIRLLLERHHFEVIRSFTYDNYRLNLRQIRCLKRMRRLLLMLDGIGMYPIVRAVYRQNQRRASGECAEYHPITAADVEALGPYESSRDARSPAAVEQRGDHLVVIARKLAV
jgi:2-polyprenyl-3-methyl-5-hydroxy-6-metoxy-1,4-benzoquinol methylase